MIDASQKAHLEQRFAATEWRGHGSHGKQVLKDFHLAGIKGWEAGQTRLDAGPPRAIRSLWRKSGEADDYRACAADLGGEEGAVSGTGAVRAWGLRSIAARAIRSLRSPRLNQWGRNVFPVSRRVFSPDRIIGQPP